MSEVRFVPGKMSEDPDADIRNTWVPGSTFKGITAAIGVDSGKLDPAANMGYVDLSWQKDDSTFFRVIIQRVRIICSAVP